MTKIISVTGMAGVGKTLLMTNLATLLAKKNHVVGCFSCDLSYPDIQKRFYGTEIPRDKAIDRTFMAPDPASEFVETPLVKKLFVAGVPIGTRAQDYEPPSGPMQVEFMRKMARSNFDFLLIEAGHLRMNLLSATALEYSNVIIYMKQPTEKGLAWHEAYYDAIRAVKNKNSGMVVYAVTPSWHGIQRDPHLRKERLEATVYIPFTPQAALGGEIGKPLALEKWDRETKPYMRAIGAIFALVTNEGGD